MASKRAAGGREADLESAKWAIERLRSGRIGGLTSVSLPSRPSLLRVLRVVLDKAHRDSFFSHILVLRYDLLEIGNERHRICRRRRRKNKSKQRLSKRYLSGAAEAGSRGRRQAVHILERPLNLGRGHRRKQARGRVASGETEDFSQEFGRGHATSR